MKIYKFFFFQILLSLLSLYQASDQKENETLSEDTEINKEEEYENDNVFININNNDGFIQNVEIEDIDFGEPLEIDDYQMDTIVLCSYISQQALINKYDAEIKNITKNLDLPEKSVYDKIGIEFLENCFNGIDITTVHKYIKNLTYFNNFTWEEKFNEFTELDPEQYKTVKDIKLTIEQKLLIKIFNHCNNEFNKRKNKRHLREIEKEKKIKIIKEKREEKKRRRLEKKIYKYKIICVIGVMIMAFIGIVYYCVKRKLDKEKEIKKKNEIKRKTI